MGALQTTLIVIHVAVSLSVIGLILLHAGRGGGLADMFGGGMGPQQLQASTVVERNLDRLTVIAGVIFAITTVSLTILLGS